MRFPGYHDLESSLALRIQERIPEEEGREDAPEDPLEDPLYRDAGWRDPSRGYAFRNESAFCVKGILHRKSFENQTLTLSVM